MCGLAASIRDQSAHPGIIKHVAERRGHGPEPALPSIQAAVAEPKGIDIKTCLHPLTASFRNLSVDFTNTEISFKISVKSMEKILYAIFKAIGLLP